MRFLRLLVGAMMVSVLVTSSWAGTFVKSTKSNSSDRLVSKLVTASVTLSGPSDTKNVYKTPGFGDFVLTQLCVSTAAAGGIQLNAAGLGAVAHLGGGSSCQTFSPGVIIAQNSQLTCSTFASATAGSYFCTIGGLLGP